MVMMIRFVAIMTLAVVLLLSGCQEQPAPEQQTATPRRLATATPKATTQVTSTPTRIGTVSQETYLGQPAVGQQPEMFLPGVISGDGIELFFSLHPNLEEAYFTRVTRGRSIIMVTYLEDAGWTEPVPVSFSSDFQDAGPFITQDGKRLYFWSNRPLTPTTPLMSHHQIWTVEREGTGWGNPENLQMPIESMEGEWDVSVTADGTMYYMANYPSLGGYGLYRAEEVNGIYQMPERVEVLSNERGMIELEAVVSPDEQFMIFYSVGREDNLTPDGRVGDLYLSLRQPSGEWSAPQNLGAPINSEAEEATPALSPDGRFLFFASNRDARTNFPDIFWVSMEALTGLLAGE